MSKARAQTSDVAVAERPEASRRRADRARGTPTQFVPTPTTEAEQQPATPPRLNYSAESVAATAPDADQIKAPTLPPAPLPGVDAEQVAARAEQVAAAQTAIDSATDTPSLMNSFASAPPTVKAQVAGELGTRMDTTLQQDTASIQQHTPDIEATLEPNTPAAAGSIAAPMTDVELEPAPTDAPDPEAVVGAPVQTEDEFAANTTVISQFMRGFSAEGGAEDVEQALANVQTTDPTITTSPGSAPPIPLERETDPQRFQTQIDSGSTQSSAALADQQLQVAALPGAERVQLASVHEQIALGELAPPAADDAAAPEGAAHYLAMNQPPELQTAFDELAGPAMQQSMEQARTQIDEAAQQRDTAHQQEIATARTATADAQQRAETGQRAAVGQARTSIETRRQSTLEQQQAAVADVEQQVTNRNQIDRTAFDDRVNTDQAQLDERYRQAETDAEAEVRQGERDAEAERQKAELESEEQSWWEAAIDVVADLFDALIGLINDIFDAVRAAVNAILDAVRDFALALIDLAADFLKGLIAAFGEFLKGLVQGLLGDIFPELAQALTDAIDGAVALANQAIDAVADTLKSAVNAIVEALRAGINALINIYQGAINTALSLARAALTGDWAAFVLQVIEAACRVAGLDSEAIFSIIGRVQETIQIIVDDPGQFFTNLLDSFIGGVQLFADRFGTHLQTGIIGWLTGTIGSAGITLPERFDLIGVISLIAQVLGLTWENLRQRMVRLVGERGVQVLEFVASYVQTLIEGGWSGLWERIQQDLTTLRDMVFAQIRDYLIERIVVNAIRILATMWEPVGWLANFLIAAYQFYTFMRDQLQRIMQVVSTVFEAVSNIARGVIAPAQASVETFLAGLLPLAIDLLARLLGLGNIGGEVREIITNVQQTIWSAIDRLIERVIGLFRGGGAGANNEAESENIAVSPTGAVQFGDTTFDAEGETHHLYIEVRDTRTVVVMASEHPDSVPVKLDELQASAEVIKTPAKQEVIQKKIDVARTRHTHLESEAVTRLVRAQIVDKQGKKNKSIPLHELQTKITDVEKQLQPERESLKIELDDAISQIRRDFKDLNKADLPQRIERIELFRNKKAPDDFMIHDLPEPRFAPAGKTKEDGYMSSSKRPFYREDYIEAMRAELSATQPDPNLQKFTASDDLDTAIAKRYFSRVGVTGYALILPPPAVESSVNDLTKGEPVSEKLKTVVNDSTFEDAQANINAKGIIAFIELLVRDRKVIIAGKDPITMSEFNDMWAKQVNKEWIEDRFRGAMPAKHEWIPSSLIDQVIDRAHNTTDGKKIVNWIRLHHEMRSDTKWIIFKLDKAKQRDLKGTLYYALQGHSGAMYLDENGKRIPQTVGQPGFHDQLEQAFKNADRSINTCIDLVIATFDTWVWDGTGTAPDPLHPRLRDGKDRDVSDPTQFSTLATEQRDGADKRPSFASMRKHLEKMKERYGTG